MCLPRLRKGVLAGIWMFILSAACLGQNYVHVIARNDDPSALRLGLHFHSSVPQDLRKLIVDDLTWLNDYGRIANSEELRKATGINSAALTGADLVAWFLSRMRAIAIATKLYPRTIIISGVRPSLGLLAFRPISGRYGGDAVPAPTPENLKQSPSAVARVGSPYIDAFHPFRRWTSSGTFEMDAYTIDDRFLIIREWENAEIRIVWLSPTFLGEYGKDDPPSRITRLAILLHEAVHVSGFAGYSPEKLSSGPYAYHINCPEIPIAGETRLFGFGNETYLGPGKMANACDNGYLGAYWIYALFLDVMARACAFCTPDERADLYWMALGGGFLRVILKLRTAATFSLDASSRGLSVDNVPPPESLTVLLRYAEERRVAGKCFDCAQKIEAVKRFKSWVEGEISRNNVVNAKRPEYSNLMVSDIEAAARWIKAANAASGAGYNVELEFLPRCSQFRGGCDEQELKSDRSWPPLSGEEVWQKIKGSPYPGVFVSYARNFDDTPLAAQALQRAEELKSGASSSAGESTGRYRPARSDDTQTGAAASVSGGAGAGKEDMSGEEHPIEALTYRVANNASNGVLNMRSGPGTGHRLVIGIPVGAAGIKRGVCRPPDDGASRNPWCEVEWRGFRGWASDCCLVAD